MLRYPCQRGTAAVHSRRFQVKGSDLLQTGYEQIKPFMTRVNVRHGCGPLRGCGARVYATEFSCCLYCQIVAVPQDQDPKGGWRVVSNAAPNGRKQKFNKTYGTHSCQYHTERMMAETPNLHLISDGGPVLQDLSRVVPSSRYEGWGANHVKLQPGGHLGV